MSPALQAEFFDFLCVSDSKESACNVGGLALIPGSRKIPWRREWLSTPVFLPGEFHGQRSLEGSGPWGHKESDNGASNTVTFLTPSHFPDGKCVRIPVHYQRVSPLGLPRFLADKHKGDGSPEDLLLSSLTTSFFRHLSGFFINGQHPRVSMCIVVLLIVVHQAET